MRTSMDVSLEFINMCIKATEIQEKWQHVPGDFFTTRYREVAVLSLWGGVGYEMPREKQIINSDHRTEERNTPWVWLPRQDQLQFLLYEIWDNGITFMIKMNNLIDFFDSYDAHEKDPFSSMEQAWLALLMKERYNKTWNGEDWEEEE